MAQNPLVFLGALLIVLDLCWETCASTGDKSYTFMRCQRGCRMTECSVSDTTYISSLPWYMQLTGWNCASNCDYKCMWVTVKDFQKDGSPIPQFFGKWPFTRVLGIQEPASVIFSILNGLSHIIMIYMFRKRVSQKAPMFIIWHVYALICVNAWFWSTIFHARDTPFTEKMDYFCALSLIFSGIFVLASRIIGSQTSDQRMTLGIIVFIVLAFYIHHVSYLAYVKFDYSYNMKVNIFVGAINSLGWFIWYFMNRKKMQYVWKAAASILTVNLLLLLEVGDFPPLWWVFDAHSLWHAGTAPIAILWYSFVIDDSLYRLKHEAGTSKEVTEETGNALKEKKES